MLTPMKNPEPTLPPGIPPVPIMWEGTQEEWIRHRQEGDRSVQEYSEQISRLNRPIELDEKGQPVITVFIDPQSGMMEQIEPSLAQNLFTSPNDSDPSS